jgi:6,7-dimethyl-8-ribityllumazine synthase
MTVTEGTLPLPLLEPPPRLLIVAAPFYRAIADDLIAGARAVLDGAGARHELVEVPGALEVPTAIRLASHARAHDGFVALGCVIRGETTHYETVCNDSSRGLMLLGLDGLCIGNGILTCETTEQAQVRAAPAQAGGQDKGGGAAAAALHLIALSRRFHASGPAEGPGRAPDDAEFLLAGGTGLTRTA